MNTTLFVRGKFGLATTLGSHEKGIECIVQEAGKLIEFKSGDLEGINLHKLYYLEKESINHYKILGTNYALKYLSSNRIHLTNEQKV